MKVYCVWETNDCDWQELWAIYLNKQDAELIIKSPKYIALAKISYNTFYISEEDVK
jgi:hypothetical protein